MSTEAVEYREDDEKVKERILFILGIYPGINGTMLQGVLGPYTKSGIWRPALEKLIEEGKVIREETGQIMTPAGRYNSYEKFYLNARTSEEEIHQ